MSEEVKSKVRELVKNGKRPEARRLLEETLGVKRTTAYKLIRDILAESEDNEEAEEFPQDLEFSEEYVYNKETGQYIFLSKKLGKNIVLEESLVKNIIKSYSAYAGSSNTLAEVSHKFSIPKAVIKEVLSILSFTKSDIPVLPEELIEKDEDEIVKDIISDKRFSIYQKLQKAEWSEIKRKAEQWDAWRVGALNPFKDFLRTWTPPERPKRKLFSKNDKRTSDLSFVIGLSDLHFGANADKIHLYHQKGWSIEDTEEAVESYSRQIMDAAAKKNVQKAYILSLGDIIHTLTGKTTKGTPIAGYPLGERQFLTAMNSLVLFFEDMIDIFKEVEVFSVSGNHDDIGDWALFVSIQNYFRSTQGIKFNISAKRNQALRIGSSLVLIEHGYSPLYKSRLPKSGKDRESYVQTVLLSKPELLVGAKGKYYITADQHHFESKEYNDFEHLMFSSLVGGDRYSDNSNLKSRQRQNAMIFDDDGLKETLHFYFD